VAEVSSNKFGFIRVALGGLGTRPWRSFEAEHILQEKPCTQDFFHEAASAALSKAIPQSQNGFKIELAKRCIIYALELATKQS
jgi:xanthine dehydrogenase YagS FAD-binding subunit